jgi:hypothetical protein
VWGETLPPAWDTALSAVVSKLRASPASSACELGVAPSAETEALQRELREAH